MAAVKAKCRALELLFGRNAQKEDMNTTLALTLAGFMSVPAAPAPSAPPRPALTAQLAAMADVTAAPGRLASKRAAFAPPGGDSLMDGALMFGTVAALATGLVAWRLCRGFAGETTGDPNCGGAVLAAGAIAGAGGALLGAGIDALFTRGPAFRAGVRVRF